MKVSNPEELPGLFQQGLNSGDVDLVVSLYEPDGVVAADPGRVVAGHAAIRSMVTNFVTQHPRFVLLDSEVVRAKDVALIRCHWTMTVTNPAGVSTTTSIGPTLVARRQPEGHWLVAIDRPLPKP